MDGGAQQLTREQLETLRRLKRDFEFFAPRILKVKTKDPLAAAPVLPLILNRAQSYIHSRIERQKRETGKVRVLILKGRQMGVSTYVQARFYHQVSLYPGRLAFILTHEQDATDTLFDMADRFYQNSPPWIRFPLAAASAKEMVFEGRESGYAVATAGGKAVGRSKTAHLFHGCLGPDTPIIDGATGRLRAMCEFSVGDVVRTHAGNAAPVSYISRQRKPAYRVTLKGLRDFPLTSTGEHRFWTPYGWKELSKVAVGDVIGFPVAPVLDGGVRWPFRLRDSARPQGGGTRETGPDTVAPSYELGRVLGLYLAEGCIVKQSKSGEPSAVSFAVHEREAGRTEGWLDAVSGLFVSRKTALRAKSKTVVVTAYGRSFATFVRGLCGELDSKRLPPHWDRCGVEFSRGVVHGYLAGDGHSSKRAGDRRISATSIRSAITIGIRDALASLGYGWACIEKKEAGVRSSRNEREAWTLRLCGRGVDLLVRELGWTMPARKRSGGYGEVAIHDGFAWVPIVGIEAAGAVDVMDFEVAHNDHSYCTIHGATHNSEVAFWPNALAHMRGVFQIVPNSPGTEIILETTAEGLDPVFFPLWQKAEAGESEYLAIFTPWFWDDGYRLRPPPDWRPSTDDAEYQALHHIDLDQLYWRRRKIDDDFLGDDKAFQREYPATSTEAFVAFTDSYIPAEKVLRARKTTGLEAVGPRIVGVDPARYGDDASGWIDRVGRVVREATRYHDLSTMQLANLIMRRIDQAKEAGDPIHALFIDTVGLGVGVYDRCVEAGYGHVVHEVIAGERSIDPEHFVDKKAEIWADMKAWFERGAQIPDSDTLQMDILTPKYDYEGKQRLRIESKDKIRARGLRSPDLADALALTFAEPVFPTNKDDDVKRERRRDKTRRPGWRVN